MRVAFVVLPILAVGLIVFVGAAVALLGEGGAILGYLICLATTMLAAWLAPDSIHRWILGLD